jgi:hypothetical protein
MASVPAKTVEEKKPVPAEVIKIVRPQKGKVSEWFENIFGAELGGPLVVVGIPWAIVMVAALIKIFMSLV